MTVPLSSAVKTQDPNSPQDVMARGRGTGSKNIEFPIGLTQGRSSSPTAESGPYMEISAFEYERKIKTNDVKSERMFTIRLPLPANLTSAFSASLDQNAPGLKGAAFDYGTGGESGVMAAVKGAGTAVGIEMAVKLAADAIMKKLGPAGDGISQVASSLQEADMRGLISATAGIAINPRTETVFNGMNLRTHGFSYMLVPRNKEEQLEVKRIIKYMTLAMHPDTPGPDSLAILLSYPYEFIVSFFDEQGDRIESIPTIPDSFLNSFTVVSNPTGMARLTEDGSPASYNISFGFTEGISLVRSNLPLLSRMFEDESV